MKMKQIVIFVEFCSAHKNWNWSRKTQEMWTSAETRRHEQTECRFLMTTVVRASFPNSHGPVEEKFAALQTSMGTVANRLDKLDATVARQEDATQQLRKSMNDNLTQLTAVMSQTPAVMTAAMASSMNDLNTVLVGVAGGPCSCSSGLLPQTQPQQQPPENTNSRFAPNKIFGHVSLNNPPPSRIDVMNVKE